MKHTLILVTSLLTAPLCHATTLVKGNSTTPFSFNQPVRVKAYDRARGTFYVGLDADVNATSDTDKTGQYAVSKAPRRIEKDPSKFIALLNSSSNTINMPIEFMTLSTCEGPKTCLDCPARCGKPQSTCPGPCPHASRSTNVCCMERSNLDANLIFVIEQVEVAGLFDENEFRYSQTKINALIPNGKLQGTETQSTDILDASGNINKDGQTTRGIIGLAANKFFIFAPLRPWVDTETGNNWGDVGSGVASVNLNSQFLYPPSTDNAFELHQVAAVPGDTGIKAKPLDVSTNEIRIGADNPTIINQADAMPFPVDIIWDDPLQELYIGIKVQTALPDQDPTGTRSIIVADVDGCGAITFKPIAPDSAFLLGNINNMVGVLDATQRDLATQKIRIMHASTGPSYLILNGGNGNQMEINNQVYALPLVDTPWNKAINGTIANKNSALVDFKFVDPAVNPGQMPTNFDQAVIVGAGPLPLQQTVPIADMVVEGDTVYVSLDIQQTENDDCGIFYSQALFDQTGKIIRWTPWSKRGFPFTAFSNAPSRCHRTNLFAVDAVTAQLWSVDGQTKQVVEQTVWESPKCDCSLVARLNSSFPCGCTAALDLDQSTRGFTETPYRYALFGGACTISFALISKAYDKTSLQSPQKVTTNFADSKTFLEMKLPQTACNVTSLEYSRQNDSILNFFFAGTQNGLFAFAKPNGDGFSASSFELLNKPPFYNADQNVENLEIGSWQKIKTLEGSITALATTGNALYVQTFQTTPLTPMLSRIFRIPFAENIHDMFALNNIYLIAQSNVDTLSSASRFNGMAIISTEDDGSTEQLVLPTNAGLYKSSRPNGVQDAITQADAQWTLIQQFDKKFVTGITAPDNTPIPTSAPSKTWPFCLQLSQGCGCSIIERSILNQVCGTKNEGPFNPVPPFFNSVDNTNCNFTTIPPITYFWSDGNRRIMISPNLIQQCKQQKLLSFPHNTIVWNILNPNDAFIQDDLLDCTKSYYWIKQIGASGILMVGTNQGVVALQ